MARASIYHNGRSFPRLFAWYNSRIGIFPPIPSVKRRSRRRRKRSRGNLFFFFLFPSFSAVDMTRAGCMSKLPDKKLAAGATGTHTPSLSAHLGYVNLGLTPLFTYIALRPPPLSSARTVKRLRHDQRTNQSISTIMYDMLSSCLPYIYNI